MSGQRATDCLSVCLFVADPAAQYVDLQSRCGKYMLARERKFWTCPSLHRRCCGDSCDLETHDACCIIVLSIPMRVLIICRWIRTYDVHPSRYVFLSSSPMRMSSPGESANIVAPTAPASIVSTRGLPP